MTLHMVIHHSHVHIYHDIFHFPELFHNHFQTPHFPRFPGGWSLDFTGQEELATPSPATDIHKSSHIKCRQKYINLVIQEAKR